MKTHLHRLIVVRQGIKQGVEHLSAVLYIKAIRKSSTTPGLIGRVHWTTYQFMWYLSTQIVSGNLSVHR